MDIKLFGKSLFSIGSDSGPMKYNSAVDVLEKKEHLIDFYRDTGKGNGSIITIDSIASWGTQNVAYADSSSGAIVGVGPVAVKTPKKGKGKSGAKAKKETKAKTAPVVPVEEKKITPKGVYELKTLHDLTFKVNTDPAYIDEQLETFKDKLGMIKTSEYDMNYGTTEIASIISRFENRKKYSAHKEFYEEFPYTTTAKIDELTKAHNHLKLGQVEQFIADMPKEAVDVMKRYTNTTKDLCGKKPVFYIIADKKDFEKSQTRRDPILLAQSPFGHFWQILSAWDKEMILVEEL